MDGSIDGDRATRGTRIVDPFRSVGLRRRRARFLRVASASLSVGFGSFVRVID